MARRTLSVLLAAGVSLGTTACGKTADANAKAAALEVQWSVVGTAKGKADSATVRGPATAEWCDSLRFVQVQALHGDTGVAIAIYPVKAFGAGRFPIVPPARADSAPPAAAIALRWFAETAIRGFQGDSGEVMVRVDRPGVFAGTFTATARSATDAARLTLRGSFRDLTVRPAGRGCVAKPQRPDSGPGVH